MTFEQFKIQYRRQQKVQPAHIRCAQEVTGHHLSTTTSITYRPKVQTFLFLFPAFLLLYDRNITQGLLRIFPTLVHKEMGAVKKRPNKKIDCIPAKKGRNAVFLVV